jgi:hypothetical protein
MRAYELYETLRSLGIYNPAKDRTKPQVSDTRTSTIMHVGLNKNDDITRYGTIPSPKNIPVVWMTKWNRITPLQASHTKGT